MALLFLRRVNVCIVCVSFLHLLSDINELIPFLHQIAKYLLWAF
jgi:hypothetical protein